MANNYDNYAYEDDSYQRRSALIKRIFIIVMIIIAVILVLLLIKGCSNKSGGSSSNKNTDYDSSLVEGAKKYFSANGNMLPDEAGDCEEIELQVLIDRGLVNVSNFTKCSTNNTYVRVCKLENGTYHYYPWYVCTDKNSETEYGTERVGTTADLIPNKTVVNFKFMPQMFVAGTPQYGETEEMWKDEIPYESYKTIGTTTYYRYRDELFRWTLQTKKYYTTSGEKTKASDVKEYYITSPSSAYTSKDSKAEGYKWFTTTSKKIYALDSNGVKVFSHDPISGYPNYDNGVCTEYQTRPIVGTSSANHYYKCSKSKNSQEIIYQYNKACGTEPNPTYSYELDNFYTCGYGDAIEIEELRVSSSTTKCNRYGEWVNSLTKCDVTKDTCRKIQPFCVYNWYKIENSASRTYYPSKSSSASGENVYYTSAPVSGAIKDESTKATVYKWYNSTTTQTSDYTAVAPKGYSGASKSVDSKWTEWTDYSTKNPKVSDGRNRQIETKTKIKLQQIKGTVDDGWSDLTTEYLTKNELIDYLNSKNYKVEKLSDITNNGELKLKIQMLVRNKKESK